ncbi:MAG: CoA transferase [Deltaproteobacteria bacterium]|nr:CoA transferase [Deltaproteobacteria bacterium]
MPGPLAGITVLDLTRLAPGPFCTMILGDMGAEHLLTPKQRTKK